MPSRVGLAKAVTMRIVREQHEKCCLFQRFELGRIMSGQDDSVRNDWSKLCVTQGSGPPCSKLVERFDYPRMSALPKTEDFCAWRDERA